MNRAQTASNGRNRPRTESGMRRAHCLSEASPSGPYSMPLNSPPARIRGPSSMPDGERSYETGPSSLSPTRHVEASQLELEELLFDDADTCSIVSPLKLNDQERPSGTAPALPVKGDVI